MSRIYCVSDLHGCFEKFIEILKGIDFTETDTLYILGDVIDRGPNSLKLVKYISINSNMISLYGNHDILVLFYLEKFIDKKKKDDIQDCLYNLTRKEYNDYFYWIADGGNTTIDEFISLSRKDRIESIEALYNFKEYIEIKVNEKVFLLIHSGIDNFDKNKKICEYKLNDFVSSRIDYSKWCYIDKYIVSGHTPTHFIDENYRGKIIKINNHIAIDCGAVFGISMGVI